MLIVISRYSWHYRLWEEWHPRSEEPRNAIIYYLCIATLLIVVTPLCAPVALLRFFSGWAWDNTLGRVIRFPSVIVK
jgi:hypothetical protein